MLTLEFSMWGQECVTHFDDEEAALHWLKTCYDYGFLVPDELLNGDVVLMDRDDMLEAIAGP